MELVNRLYVANGWINSTWQGNGGRSKANARDSMFDEAPSNLRKQAQGSITHVSPGDVVSVNVMDGSTFEPDGHVLIISAVNGSSVTYVSQNAGSNTSSTVTTTGQLLGSSLTVKASGSWTYPVIGVVHAPVQSSGSTIAALYSANGPFAVKSNGAFSGGWTDEATGVQAIAVSDDTIGALYTSGLFAVKSNGAFSGGWTDEATGVQAIAV
ncbi:MAG: hypothetical protein JOZ92_00880, partial [Candidatus Dormibacteraeota bacterium]|nr:hypothetical protein [Candidatus Dormibacteraeota bacterium]